ncbi:DUF5663 domain-containing protein [Actinoplanes sp. CA-015351]|uniref:DUF5663 domain-containing protein n=1 Tax=Actinoplanes sp. CA-015351 TaxID=3239897 RepID=UPI003D964702
MIRLDDRLLEQLGLDALPASHRRALLMAIYQELEIRVGVRLAAQMDGRQLNEFEGFVAVGDKASALAFLEREFPLYKRVVEEEFDRLRTEIGTQLSDIQALSQVYGDVHVVVTPLPDPWKASAKAAGQ